MYVERDIEGVATLTLLAPVSKSGGKVAHSPFVTTCQILTRLDHIHSIEV